MLHFFVQLRMYVYVVTGANARRCLRMQNDIIASKIKPPVRQLNSIFLHNSVLIKFRILR